MCKHVKTQTKRRETRLINTFSSKHVLGHIVLYCDGARPVRTKILPLLGGGRSCACFASYKCGEGVHPVREILSHPEFDSVSIQYGQTGINRFRVEHGMTRVKLLSVVSLRHLSVGEIEDNLTTPFIPLPKGDNQELGGVAC